ncbi:MULTISPECIES: quorum-sensing sensor histidine kinase AgrC [Mammaliicoccus]|uniref:quorum-sensing sensor histidine kinase AgrC n=1 Tax=Mammaliicoccus TaxID=2803850 RepID=UPI00066B0F99|nr:GHKL domain-containing protein [Mammaliicoccus sciuri]MBF0719737.1 GHKL domain-containing protein [Mammaliicoccus sciuri]MBG9206633.1 GHKL domain-containing protein [Mammaliicoccus sciuri]MBU6089652.1 GHKL domain-containing protein [Mammaliicoccus sciuri]MBW3108988.1 GHKL domain-containing protein [Mammaliicoccus sciuri]MCD8771907.1 GHKL domain-containing protein [Mammaliicoccus sciuri]
MAQLSITETIIYGLFQTSLFVVLLALTQNYRYSKRDYVILLLGYMIPSLALYFIVGVASIIFVITFLGVFFYFKFRIFGIINTLLVIIISVVSDYLSSLLIRLIFNIEPSAISTHVFYFVFHFIISVSIAIIIRQLMNRLKLSYLYNNRIYLLLLAAFLGLSFTVFYVYMPKSYNTEKEFEFQTLFYVIYVCVAAIFIILISFTVIREMALQRTKKEINQYYKYTLQIEQINNEMRKFRHDYVNILATLSEYIREDDMDGLRTYFDQNIAHLHDDMKLNAIKINGLQNLHVREIKGLLTTKIIQSQEQNINISVEITEQIDHINMNIVELSRCIGIIMDNAIEASEFVDNPTIQIAFIKNEKSILLVFMNKCSKDTPKVHKLFENHYSTKGRKRGIGLTTLKEITEKTDHVFLDTFINNQYFIQKLEILNDSNEEVIQ